MNELYAEFNISHDIRSLKFPERTADSGSWSGPLSKGSHSNPPYHKARIQARARSRRRRRLFHAPAPAIARITAVEQARTRPQAFAHANSRCLCSSVSRTPLSPYQRAYLALRVSSRFDLPSPPPPPLPSS